MTPDRLSGRTTSRLLWLLPMLTTTLIVAFVLGDGQDPRPPGTTEPGNARQQQDAAGERERAVPANPARGRQSSVPIPGGRYAIGSDPGGSDEQPVHTVCLAPFRIGRFEVTNAEFARFLNSLGVRPRSDADADADEVGADSAARPCPSARARPEPPRRAFTTSPATSTSGPAHFTANRRRTE